MAQRDAEVVERCEKLGESTVRDMLAHGEFHDGDISAAESWLRHREAENTATLLARMDAKVEKAMEHARVANRLATGAIILSLVTGIIVMVLQFFSLILKV